MFTTNRLSRWHDNLRAGTRRALLALALAGSAGTAALVMPATASAATASTGPGGISYNADLREYPANGYTYTSGPLAGCEVWVGDHYRSDARASGEGEIWCNARHNFSMRVYLDYETASGLRTATSASATWTGGPDTWWYLYTNGMCQPGGAATYAWTTYVEISVDGSGWLGWFTSRKDASYTIPAC